jgi:hypothetical protein
MTEQFTTIFCRWSKGENIMHVRSGIEDLAFSYLFKMGGILAANLDLEVF